MLRNRSFSLSLSLYLRIHATIKLHCAENLIKKNIFTKRYETSDTLFSLINRKDWRERRFICFLSSRAILSTVYELVFSPLTDNSRLKNLPLPICRKSYSSERKKKDKYFDNRRSNRKRERKKEKKRECACVCVKEEFISRCIFYSSSYLFQLVPAKISICMINFRKKKKKVKRCKIHSFEYTSRYFFEYPPTIVISEIFGFCLHRRDELFKIELRRNSDLYRKFIAWKE